MVAGIAYFRVSLGSTVPYDELKSDSGAQNTSERIAVELTVIPPTRLSSIYNLGRRTERKWRTPTKATSKATAYPPPPAPFTKTTLEHPPRNLPPLPCLCSRYPPCQSPVLPPLPSSGANEADRPESFRSIRAQQVLRRAP